MNTNTKDKGSKPYQLIKALFGCTVLFCIPGLILTFIVASFTIELTRVNQDRVDATAFKKSRLFMGVTIIPFKRKSRVIVWFKLYIRFI